MYSDDVEMDPYDWFCGPLSQYFFHLKNTTRKNRHKVSRHVNLHRIDMLSKHAALLCETRVQC